MKKKTVLLLILALLVLAAIMLVLGLREPSEPVRTQIAKAPEVTEKTEATETRKLPKNPTNISESVAVELAKPPDAEQVTGERPSRHPFRTRRFCFC